MATAPDKLKLHDVEAATVNGRFDELRANLRDAQATGERLVDLCMSVSAANAARLFDMSERAWRRLDARRQVPEAVRIGRTVRWRLVELVAWADSGCPDRRDWRALRDAALARHLANSAHRNGGAT